VVCDLRAGSCGLTGVAEVERATVQVGAGSGTLDVAAGGVSRENWPGYGRFRNRWSGRSDPEAGAGADRRRSGGTVISGDFGVAAATRARSTLRVRVMRCRGYWLGRGGYRRSGSVD